MQNKPFLERQPFPGNSIQGVIYENLYLQCALCWCGQGCQGRHHVRLRTGTCIAVKHSKAVSVMVSKELGSYHTVVLLHNLHIALIKLLLEPGLASLLLKDARWNMPHNIDLPK